MARIAVPCQQQHGIARPAPVEHFQLHSRFQFNKSDDMGRRVFPWNRVARRLYAVPQSQSNMATQKQIAANRRNGDRR
jgi:hypothetical protein